IDRSADDRGVNYRHVADHEVVGVEAVDVIVLRHAAGQGVVHRGPNVVGAAEAAAHHRVHHSALLELVVGETSAAPWEAVEVTGDRAAPAEPRGPGAGRRQGALELRQAVLGHEILYDGVARGRQVVL